MNTDRLIQALVVDGSRPAVPVGRTLWRSLGLASIGAMLSLFIRQPRMDIVQAFSSAPFVFKLVVSLSVTATYTLFLLDAARPVPARRRHWFLVMAPLLLAGGVIVELLTVPSQAWPTHLLGHNAAHCLTFIPLISLAPLACLLVGLRSGAPAHPGVAGAVAGVVAGGVAATVYALTCPDDSPLFIATWYSGAIAMVTVASACIGGRLLRW
jgi:hypothetical protein